MNWEPIDHKVGSKLFIMVIDQSTHRAKNIKLYQYHADRLYGIYCLFCSDFSINLLKTNHSKDYSHYLIKIKILYKILESFRIIQVVKKGARRF